jgi:hypothetical protein
MELLERSPHGPHCLHQPGGIAAELRGCSASVWMLVLLVRQGVEVEPSAGALLQCLLERLAGGEVNDGSRLGDEPGVGSASPYGAGQ